MSSQTRNHLVLLNDLILDNIFSNLHLNELLPFRLVCQKWRNAINLKISQEKIAIFYKALILKRSYLEELEYIRKLKIGKVVIGLYPFCPEKSNEEHNCKRNTCNFYQAVGYNGSQIRDLCIQGVTSGKKVVVEGEIAFFKNLLKAFPNLENLRFPLRFWDPLFFQEFQDFVYPSLRFLNLMEMYEATDSGEKAGKHLLKMFPNLDTNFDCEDQDIVLLEMVKKNEMGQTKIRNFYKSFCKNTNIDSLKMLMCIYPASMPLTSLHLCCNHLLPSSVITGILQNFSQTLTTIKLFSEDKIGAYREIYGEICLPPLHKVRKMCLGMPYFDVTKGRFNFLWNLGRHIAKDFPLLEYLILGLNYPNLKPVGNDFDAKLTEGSCTMWEFFAPIPEYDEDDLSPFKFLKFVDLSFPQHWIGKEENREWCKRFLKSYLKIYENAGKTKVMQSMIDWLK